ncbi:MAG: DUF6036 family nucleotidyltransferase [Candidatus Nanoarchaeia archaeon]
MISKFEEINKFFKELEEQTNKKLNLYIIGGAALLFQGMKPATKDIDIIVDTKEEFLELQKILLKLNFKTNKPGLEYSRMNLSQIFQREDLRIDLFEKEVCGKFYLSKSMIKRAKNIGDEGMKNLEIYLVSNEDIFLFKTMTEREGDLTDCISLATKGLNWKNIIDELKAQTKEKKKEVWITWVGERLDILEERGLNIPIMKEIDGLREQYFDELEKK